MKTTLKLLSGLVLLIIAGCAPGPHQALDALEKLGADKVEIKKVLLECGMLNPHDAYMIDNRELSINANTSIYACLSQAGFHSKLGWDWRDRCRNYNAEDLPICVPGTVIPKRSVERRLKSAYCQKYKTAPECEP
ncbi:hypothetical protein [Bartonella sp. B1098]|uniref:hypothetical protein n=1 Tax=Bartonella sp. B1098 TaxID=2911421 RepID=UPI0020C4B5A4|nr:hypothetical protein [Bartonella sp. B1098]